MPLFVSQIFSKRINQFPELGNTNKAIRRSGNSDKTIEALEKYTQKSINRRYNKSRRMTNKTIR